MGLAASQARLLMLTMRMNDVEGRLQYVANQKLAISRQTSDLSQEYSNSLNARKLVWSQDGSTATDLTYALLMSPSLATVNKQYFVADSFGRVILNDAYANVFDSSGKAKSGNVGNVSMAQFLAKQMRLASETEAQKYIDDSDVETVIGGEGDGGGEPVNEATNFANMQATSSNLMTYIVDPNSSTYNNGDLENFKATLKEYSNEIANAIQFVSGLSNSQMKTLDMDTLRYSSTGNSGSLDKSLSCTTTGDTDASKTTYGSNSELDYLIRLQRTTQSALKLLDLYAKPGNSNQTPTKTITQAITMLMQGGTAASYGTGLVNEPAAILAAGDDAAYGGGNIAVNGDVGYKTEKYQNWTYTKVFGVKIPTGYEWGTRQVATSLIGLDYDYNNQWKGTQGGAATFSKDAVFTEDINTLMGKFSTVHQVNAANAGNAGGTNGTGGTDSPSNTTLSKQNIADFYIRLYDAIKSNGWTRNSAIDSSDGKYLQNLIINGSAYLYKYSNGGWSMMSSSDSESPIRNIADEEASKVAEAKYESEKDKLDYKEKRLDVETNTLDTERAAIQTETDSVQKIIDYNIKKFKMFESA